MLVDVSEPKSHEDGWRPPEESSVQSLWQGEQVYRQIFYGYVATSW